MIEFNNSNSKNQNSVLLKQKLYYYISYFKPLIIKEYIDACGDPIVANKLSILQSRVAQHNNTVTLSL